MGFDGKVGSNGESVSIPYAVIDNFGHLVAVDNPNDDKFRQCRYFDSLVSKASKTQQVS